MNRVQYLFNLLSEEASEVAQNASKCIRFTPFHKSPKYTENNIERLQTEITDFVTIIQMLEEELRHKFDMTPSEDKRERVEQYYEISRQLGTVK